MPYVNCIRAIPEYEAGSGFVETIWLQPAIDNQINDTSPSNTGSELCRSVATKWFVRCVSSHKDCRKDQAFDSWLPTRLIDVGLDSAQQPRLILTSGLEQRDKASYVTLSHRWAATQVVTLTSSNIESYLRQLPVATFSATFLDAIRATQALGIQYLWIDFLSIIQDSFDDWQAEATQMGNVYQNCICNLAAPGSADDGGGLFQQRDPCWVTPTKIHIQYKGHDQIYLAYITDAFQKWVSGSSLNRRGWVLQERFASPRTLHFASQLFWECRMLMASETFPGGIPDTGSYVERGGNELPMSVKNLRAQREGLKPWKDLVKTFVRCDITKPEDRLIAIAGIAKSFHLVNKDEYLAGLWKKDLPWNLAWRIYDPDGEAKVSETYRCPSWSWAAHDYKHATIENVAVDNQLRVKELVSVAGVHIQPYGSDAFGILSGGFIRLTGRIGHMSRLNFKSGFTRHWQCYVDTSSRVVDDRVYCLPLYILRYDKSELSRTDCLVLKRLNTDAEYIRIGLVRVHPSSGDLLPKELRWIMEYSKAKRDSKEFTPLEPGQGDAATITIY